MLLAIRNYIAQQHTVSNQQLARHFHIDVQALQPMLDIWLKKGVIRRCHQEAACQSTCFRCNINASVFFEVVK